MEEANKLIGTGKKHLVMGKVVDAVSALQEACGMLAKKYGDTADECGEAFFWYGKSLLDLARMENSVLGNALEGVPEEDEDENKPKDSNVESAENVDEKTRDELRVQVYDAMAEKKDEKAEGKQNEDTQKAEAGSEQEKTEKGERDKEKNGEVNGTKPHEGEDDKEKETEKEEKSAEKEEESAGNKEKSAEKEEKPAENKEKPAEMEEEPAENKEKPAEMEEESAENKEKPAEMEEESAENKEKPAEMEEESAEKEELADKQEEAEDGEEEAEEDSDAEEQGEGDAAAEEKDSDDEEVGNLQLAWEMLEVAKVIYKRKDTKEDQLMAAQAHLKLGEVSAESGNYTQALDDFQECLKLQLKHLDSDSRLLAETHYQLGVTYSLNLQYSKAIEELSSSITVIKSRLDKLQQMLDKAEGPDALPDERKELEELKALLPEIQEKVEDATEGMKTASTAAEAIKGVLDGASSSSAFPVQNDSSSSSEIKVASTNGVGSTNGHASTAPASDISHLVRKKRKPEESPVKEGVVKKVKQDNGHEEQEPQTNGVHKANGDAAASMEVESQ